jgi:hypothetical protein
LFSQRDTADRGCNTMGFRRKRRHDRDLARQKRATAQSRPAVSRLCITFDAANRGTKLIGDWPSAKRRAARLLTDWRPSEKRPLPKPQLAYTRRFTRVFKLLLGDHEYRQVPSESEALVVFENRLASPGPRRDRQPEQAARLENGLLLPKGQPFEGQGRDALAKNSGDLGKRQHEPPA